MSVTTEPVGVPTWRNIYTHPEGPELIEVQTQAGEIVVVVPSSIADGDWRHFTGWRPYTPERKP